MKMRVCESGIDVLVGLKWAKGRLKFSYVDAGDFKLNAMHLPSFGKV